MKDKLDKETDELLQSIEAFNLRYGGKGWNIKNVEIEKREISNIRLANSTWNSVDLIEVVARNSHLKNHAFSSCLFKNDDFSGSQFDRCTFTDCNFSMTNLTEAKFASCHFTGCTFEDVQLNSSSVAECNFTSPRIRHTEWQYAAFVKTLFSKGTIEQSSFSSSTISDSRFDAVTIERFGLSSSQITNCRFSLTGSFADFSRSKVHVMTMEGVGTLNEINIAGASGDSLSLIGLEKSESVKLSFCQIQGLRIEKCNLSYAGFIAAELTDALFKDVRFSFVQFNECTLKRGIFENVGFADEIIFDDAKLEDVAFNKIDKLDRFSASFKNTLFEKKPPF